MTHVKDPATEDRSMPPTPCNVIGLQPSPARPQGLPPAAEHQANMQALGFLQQWYACMDQGPAARAQLPIRPETIACFQKGAPDRFVGQQPIVQAASRCHQGQNRDLSGLTTHIFGGAHMLCLVCGDMVTAASQPSGLKHRFADFFMISAEGGPHVKNMVMREIDEDMGAPPAGAQPPTDPRFAQADGLGGQFLPAFYGMLDDPAKRPGIQGLLKDATVMTMGKDMFKGAQHIAHKLHYFPPLVNAQARKVEGFDAQPSPAGGVFLFAHGELMLQGESHTQRFIDLFHLMPEGQNWWITNVIFQFHGGGTQ